MNKLITIPLFIIFILSILSIIGLGNSSLGSPNLYSPDSNTYWYDKGGVAKVFANNLTGVYESGTVVQMPGFLNIGTTDKAGWLNSTLPFSQPFALYYDNYAKKEVKFEDVAKIYSGGQGVSITTININSSLGLIAIVVGLIALAAIVGFKLLDSGESDVSVGMILKSTGFLSIWSIFSILCYQLLLIIPYGFGMIFYFSLTLFYAMGLIDSIGHPSH